MLRKLLSVVLALAVCVGGMLAAEGTIVKMAKGELTVKVDGKEQKFKITKKTHFHDADGKDVKGKERAKLFKAGAKVEVKEKGGAAEEVSIKK